MPTHKSTAEQIRGIREALNVSQEQLAARLGVSFATVNRWELGKSKPQRAQLDAITQLCDQTDLIEVEPLPGAIGSRRRRGVSRSAVLGNKSMEQMLWDAACSIRGEKDAPKFKDYLLPLLFIKRLSDVFDDEIARLAEQFGDKESALAIVEQDAAASSDTRQRVVRFYIPPEARWPVLSGRVTHTWPEGHAPKSLGEQLTVTIRAIVKHNPSLAGVIDIVDYNETRNGEREISDAALKAVIETFSDPRYRLGLRDVEPDFLGRCYEYLLRKFAEGQAQSAGEFFTPTEVGFLIAELMRPRPGEECYDYACGSFGLLIKLQLVCRRLDPLSKVSLRLYGQELRSDGYAIAQMNRIIHDMDGEILRGDSMRNPKFRDADGKLRQFDLVVANPMWNQTFDSDVFENDAFDRFEQQGGLTSGKGDWAWLQHTAAALRPGGRAAVVLDTGAVTRGSGNRNEDRERNIRRWFVEQDLIDGVILLPDNLFYNTTAAGIIIVLRQGKPKDRQGRIVLVNASAEFRKGLPKNYLTEESLTRIARTYADAERIDGFSTIITTQDAAAQDFNLSPSSYVRANNQQTHRPIADLAAELAALESRAESVDAQLKQIIGVLLR
jgi:type I restriction enzyme M protein